MLVSYNCGMNGSVFYYLQRSGSGSTKSEMKSCTRKFTVAVPETNLGELNNGNAMLLSVLQKGFELG